MEVIYVTICEVLGIVPGTRWVLGKCWVVLLLVLALSLWRLGVHHTSDITLSI